MNIQKKLVAERLQVLGLLPVVDGPTCSFVERHEELQKALSRAMPLEVDEEEEMATIHDLIASIRDVMGELAELVIFEENTEETRQEFVDATDDYFNYLQFDGTIEDYYIVCNETNNTPEIINASGFVASVYLRLSQTDKFISMDMIVGPPKEKDKSSLFSEDNGNNENGWWEIQHPKSEE